MLGSCHFPRGARVMLVSLSALLVFAGSACHRGHVRRGHAPAGVRRWRVAGHRVRGHVHAMAALLRVAAVGRGQPAHRGHGHRAAHLLCAVPRAHRADGFLIPLVFVPLCGLCVALSVREMQVDQPMFEDVPRQHPRVYRQAVADYWRSALCVGALAFAGGVIRGIALLHEEVGAVVNSASVLGSFVAAVVLLVLWYRMSFRFGLTSVFRVAYPVVITGFLLLPFLGGAYLNLFAAFMYMVFSLVQMLMMM
ncbi:MAG: LuxR family transcriptional regulator, partial [Eggerthellaceae bacterium]